MNRARPSLFQYSRTGRLDLATVVVASVAWGSTAAAAPVTVSLVQQPGAAVQLRIHVPTGAEPVLAWAGTRGPGPYPLALIWSDSALKLKVPLPAFPTGPLHSIALRTVGTTDRLEVLLREPVYPKLRRLGSTWILELEPEPAQTAAAPPQSAALQTPPVAAPTRILPPPPPPAEGSATPVFVPHVAPAARPPQVPPPAAQPEQLLVDFTVNGLRQAEIARAEQLPDGKVLVASENWEAARLVPPGPPVAMSDGTPGFALDAVAGLRYRVDKQRMSIDVEAPPAAFMASTMDTRQEAEAAPPRPPPGALLNYDITATRPANGAPATAGATVEAVGFGPLGTAVTSALLSDDGTRRKLVRLDSFWQYDMPQSMQTVVIGDTIGVGGGWSRPVRYGGLRWGRDFGLRPGFVTMPLPTLSGQAALPSTVDLLVNDSPRFSQSVRPGPFDIANVPVISGAGELSLVVRDLLGRQTVIQQSYYASPRLLAPDLTDFSLEAGWLRTGFGANSEYRDPFAATTVRRGLTSRVTAEARLEVQRERQAGGFEIAGLLGTWGVGRVALAASRDDVHGSPEQGTLVQVGVERSTPLGGGAIHYEHATRGFAPFGESSDPSAASLRSRDQVLASIGGRIWGPLTGGVNYVRRTRWSGERASLVGLSLSVPIAQRASLTLSVAKRFDDSRAWSGTINLNVPLADDLYAGARTERQEDGHSSSSVFAARNPPAGPGLGWRAETSTNAAQRARAGLQYNTNHGDFSAEAVADADARVSSRAGARGTFGLMSGLPFASRPIGHGSFAVVQVEGMPGVPIKRSNQVVAQTDDRGLAFVPGLVPWHKNVIEIDAADLPLDAEIPGVTQDVVPYARSGALVRFDVRRTRQALLVLHRPDGQPVPVGTRVQLQGGSAEFRVGRRGEVWLTDLAADQQRIRVSWDGQGCELDLRIPPSEDGAPVTLGPMVCDGRTP